MITNLPRNMRRIVALSVLAALLLVAMMLGSIPLRLMRTQDDEIALLGQRELALQDRIRDRSALISERDELGDRIESDPSFFRAATAALASATLQGILTELVQKGGGAVSSVQILPPTSEDVFTRITLRISFTTTSEGLRQFLYQVEAHQPVLFTDEVAITSPSASDTIALPDTAALNAVVAIYGYVRTEAGK